MWECCATGLGLEQVRERSQRGPWCDAVPSVCRVCVLCRWKRFGTLHFTARKTTEKGLTQTVFRFLGLQMCLLWLGWPKACTAQAVAGCAEGIEPPERELGEEEKGGGMVIYRW